MVDIRDLDEEELFEELWKLISDIHEIARKYPLLYRIYLRVATKERIERIKKKEEVTKK